MSKQPTEPADQADQVTPEEYRFEVVMEWGAFVFRVMNVRDMIRLRPKIRENWGGPLPINGTPDGLADLNSVEYAMAAGLAEMEIACLEAPEGWAWSDLFNPDRLWDLWVRYQKDRDTFRDGMGRN
jgi:hypothetical protein